MREQSDNYELDNPKARNATALLKSKDVNPREYAKGAIECCKEQLKTAQSRTRIAKLNASIRRWQLVLEEPKDKGGE